MLVLHIYDKKWSHNDRVLGEFEQRNNVENLSQVSGDQRVSYSVLNKLDIKF